MKALVKWSKPLTTMFLCTLTLMYAVILCLLIITSATVVYANPTAEENTYRLTFEHMRDIEPQNINIVFIIMKELMRDFDIKAPLGQEATYSQEKSSSYELRNVDYKYSASISIQGKFIDMSDYEHIQAHDTEIRFVGNMDFMIDHSYISITGDSSRKVSRNYKFSGPFTTMMYDRFGEQTYGFVLGYDEINVLRDDRVRVEVVSDLRGSETFDDIGMHVLVFRTFRPYYEGEGAPITTTIDTEASDTPGVTSNPVQRVIVVGLAGLVAAAAGTAGAAGAAGSATGGEGNGDNNKGSSYKMYIYKDFGDAIRYDKPEVAVYARMAEITPDGAEIQRMDLTGRITIFSNDRQIKVGTPTTAGSYMGATVWAESLKGGSNPNQGVISFRFTGEGGSFQNNVTFRLIGDPIIRIAQRNIYILAGSGETFYLNYELIDFYSEQTAQVKVNIMNNNPTFKLEVGEDHQGYRAVIATDNGTEQENNHLYGSSINCEIIAENEKEYARTLFSVVNCYEGLFADFMGHEGEIKGYGKDRTQIDALAEPGMKMEKTPVIYQLALWNAEKKELVRYKPENLKLSIEDEKGIFESIGIDIELQQDFRREDATAYYLSAKRSFPSMELAEGILKAVLTYNGECYQRESKVKLLPDPLREHRTFEEEYKDTIYIVNEYYPEGKRQERLKEIEENINKWGTEDLKTYRKAVWETAQEVIFQERDQHLQNALWYDRAIGVCNVLIFVGDIAFSVAVLPLGGPVTAFLMSNVKQAVINMAEIYFSSDSIGWNELDRFITDHVKYLSGQADVFYGPPKKNEPKKLAAWLAGFTLYRIGYHWMWSKDEYGRPVGMYGAIVNGIKDLTKKGVGIMLKDYVKSSAKTDGALWKKEYSQNMSENVTEEAQNMLGTAKDAIDGMESAVITILNYLDYLSGGQLVLKS